VLRDAAKPTSEKPWVAWSVVVIWSLFVFLTIPFARTIRNFVSENWGRDLFTYSVLVVIAVALVASAFYVIRYRVSAPKSHLLWLTTTAIFFTAYTIYLGKRSPEESIHFIQYGVLGILVFRALSIKYRDITIYFSASIIGGMIGIIDELIQWLIPERFWDFRDVWINFFAAALVQVAISKGLRPAYISNRPSIQNIRFLCRLLAAAAAMIGVSLLNTPERVAWYAERIPGLEYLKNNESIMVEYAYQHHDPEIGIFFSRFPLNDLRKTDLARGKEAAAVLNMYPDRASYKDFLKIYTSAVDPFLHEARVHLYSRDANFSVALNIGPTSDGYEWALTKAYRENQILEKYFSNTLQSSIYVWPPEKFTLTEQYLQQEKVFRSWVSRHLITSVTDIQVATFFVLLVVGLVLSDLYLKRRGRLSK